MVSAFDTLGYSKRLRDAGVESKHADAHAEATRDFIMTELATKSDLLSIKSDLQVFKGELESRLTTMQLSIEKSALQTTIRLGGIVAVGVGVLVALQRIH